VTHATRTFARAEAVRVRVPFRKQVRTAAGAWTHRESWIVRIVDRTGRTGLGEAPLDFGASEAAGAELGLQVRQAIENLVRGQALPDGAHPSLAAAIDAAVVGLARGSFGSGVAAGSVAVNATIGYQGVAETVAAAEAAMAAGFGTLKLKAGPELDTAELVERVAAVRAAAKAAGRPMLRLRLDVNGAWDVDMARERIAAVAPFDIEFVEQPVAAGDPHFLAGVREGSPVPVGADESVADVQSARELLAARAADVLVVKLARVGGPTAAREIAGLAGARGVPIVVSTLFETGVGIAAALHVAAALGAGPFAHGLATADLLESDLLSEPLAVVAGRMLVPMAISLDEAAVDRYAVERIGSGT
jgi:L-Ala-D/L-Glu epimerase